MKALALRIGLYRVAAILVALALVLEVARVAVLPGTRAVSVACTLAEVVLVGCAVGLYLLEHRRKNQ